ncbi:hypothetical protein GL50803_0028832 [Giardia duodenalis]|uniref:Uncharacterized protein n=1 Tax=Giardia intestinalis (strain ATCC 50803 / WB clone C6) TaxID=184922 RepID=A0A644F3I6_GIAIC|nr:hypothetical protein GL50803_0028832 [Giardia intestinalis]KAE8303169.1 hypothetical protein GL50803_0028832 [Giardia intestinalis]
MTSAPQPSGLFDPAPRPTAAGDGRPPAAAAPSFVLAGDPEGLAGAFLRVVHQALVLGRLEALLDGPPPAGDAPQLWAGLLRAALAGAGTLDLGPLAAQLGPLPDPGALPALVRSLPAPVCAALFGLPGPCPACGAPSQPGASAVLAPGEALAAGARRVGLRCESCTRPDALPLARPPLLRAVAVPLGFAGPVPLRLPGDLFLGAVVTRARAGHALSVFVNPAFAQGRSDLVRDRRFVLYAPPAAELRAQPGSRAAELTYLRYRKVQAYLERPAAAREAASFGAPRFVFYFDGAILHPTIREQFQRFSTTTFPLPVETINAIPQNQETYQPPSESTGQSQEPLPAITVAKVVPVRRTGPLIEISSAESSAVSHIESIDDAVYTAESRVLINEESTLYESRTIMKEQRHGGCLSVMREHLLIYIIIIILFLLTIILIILIVVLYIKLVDLKVANLTVTNKALVGYSNWSDPAILQAPPTGQAGAPTTYSLITPSFLEQRSSSINVTTVDTQLESLNSGTTLSNSALTVTRAFFDTIKAVTIAFNVSLIKNSASARATLNATTLEISSQLNATTLNAEKLDVPVIHAQTMSLSNSKLTANTLVFTESMTVDTIAHRTLTVETITTSTLSVGGAGNTFSITGGPVTVTPLAPERGVNITAEADASPNHFAHIQSDSTEDTNLTISALTGTSEITVSFVVIKDSPAGANSVSLNGAGSTSTLTVSGANKPDTVLTVQVDAASGSVSSALNTPSISCGSITTTRLESAKCICDKNP